MLSSDLKENTRKPHQALEKVLVERLKNVKVKGDYAAILKIFYGFLSPLEKKIAMQGVGTLLPDYGERRKAEWLKADLNALQSGTEEIAICHSTPDISNTFRAIGALYVLEGSTLGGQVIKKMIHERLGDEVSDALSFFSGYNGRTVEMWGKFTQVLNSCTNTEEVEAGAYETFAAFKNWITENGEKKL